jgi:hypothetical protein
MAFSQVILDISKENKQTRYVILRKEIMNYVNVEKLNEALAEIGKYINEDIMKTVERHLKQGISDWYDNQAIGLAESDTKALGIKVVDEYVFDESPF